MGGVSLHSFAGKKVIIYFLCAIFINKMYDKAIFTPVRVGKNGFCYNKKSGYKHRSRQSIFAGSVVRHNEVILSVKKVKRIDVVTSDLEEIARIKLADIVNKRRRNKVETHNALKE